MPAARRARKSQPVDEDEYPRKPFDIPYFSHQNLDPVKFPDAVGLPVGGPPLVISASTIDDDAEDWEEGESNNNDEGENNSGEDYTPENVNANGNKRRRKSAALAPADGNTYKRMKMTGGRPAMAKKVVAEMDSDDELIFNMKNAKYLEKDIAKRLADEGRIHYNPKTIGTRWARLKKAMQAKQDELLDADLTDWHDGDDDALYQAIAKADAAVDKARREAEARKWRIVADDLKLKKPVTNFSQAACERRYQALQTGTAKPTPESIQNPDATVRARIVSRRENEARIAVDTEMAIDTERNLDGNAWTSRMRKYF